MKNKSFYSGIALTLALVFVFTAGKAYAAGCFTDFNTAAACWMKDNGIATPYGDGSYRPNEFLKRSDAANYLFRANKVPPRVGDFHFSQSLSSITANGNFPNGKVGYYGNSILLQSSVVGVQYYQAQLTVPTSVYGKATVLKGMRVCYRADFGGATLTRVELAHYYVDAVGTVSLGGNVVDTNSRTDKTCREYYLTTPITLAGDDHVTGIFAVNFTATDSTTGKMGINSINVILSPSQTNSSFDAMRAPASGIDMDPSTLSPYDN